jgi:3-oxoadipate enol-lactonase
MTSGSDLRLSSDGELTTVELPGGEQRVVWRRGEGRPLLVIQGLSGTHDHWGDALVSALVADGRSLIAINHRGVYRTAEPEAGYSIADLADDQAAVLKAIGITEPVDVFGISMGGMTAQELALRHPELVRTLALGCTTAGGRLMTPPSTEDITTLFEAQQSGDRDRAFRAGYEINLSERQWQNKELWDEFLASTERAPVPVPVILGQMQAIAQHDTGDRLGEIAVPTLVMHGTLDRMLPFANAAELVSRIPGVQFETFEGDGHLFFWESPARVAELLEALSARG